MGLMLAGAAATAMAPAPQNSTAGGRSVTKGKGVATIPKLVDCSAVRGRPTPLGTIRSTDGKTWVSPAEVSFAKGPRATDLYNDCTNVRLTGIKDLDLSKVPIQEVDQGGEVITGYLFADNYFELYVNGKLVAVDATPFTPFNSSVVRFRAKRPVTYAIKAVDWEENVGLGTESGGAASPHHPGDAGLMASFSDGTVTDASWKAQSFYIAPLDSPDRVVERGNIHDSSSVGGRTYPSVPGNAACGENCYAVRYPVPADWASPRFNDAGWPNAFTYTEAEVGASQPAFRNFRDQLTAGGAGFIWSNSLVLDNLVLARKTVR